MPTTYKCPKCGNCKGIYLHATIQSGVTTDPFGEPQIDEVDKDSFFTVADDGFAECGACLHDGTAASFKNGG